MYKDKEKKKNTDALYRKQHWFAIKLKNQMYRRLPHVIERRKKENQKRKAYRQKHYQEHKEYYRIKNSEWQRNNPEKRKAIVQRYCQKLKRKRHASHQINRITGEFLEYCAQRYAKDTVRQYRMNICRFLKFLDRQGACCKEYHAKWYQENKKPAEERDNSWTKEFQRIYLVADIDKELITEYVSFVNNDETNAKGLKLTQSEKETRLYPLKTFLLYCQKKGFLKKDLRKFIIVPAREKKVLSRVLTQEEMDKFLQAPDENTTPGIRDRAILELSYSGFRASEVLSLKLKDVDLATNAVTILNAKGDKDRVVPMTTEAMYWVKRWLARRQEFIGSRPDEEYLFLSRSLKTLTRRDLSRIIKNYIKKINLPIDISPHDLRRTTATHLAENGAPIRLIQALLGHTTLKVTTKYLRLTDERIKKEHKETHPSNRRDLYYGSLQR